MIVVNKPDIFKYDLSDIPSLFIKFFHTLLDQIRAFFLANLYDFLTFIYFLSLLNLACPFNMLGNATLEPTFDFFSIKLLLSKDEMVNRVNAFMSGIGLENFKFEHAYNPHGEGIDICDLEPC
jgi:hypothetical protein